MRIATVRTPQGPRCVVLDGERTRMLPEHTVSQALREGLLTELDAVPTTPVDQPDALDLGPAVPDPGKIICVGHNYRAHLREMGHEPPHHPTLFAKFPAALVGPRDDVVLDPVATGWDWEAELAVVIGHSLRHGDRGEAESAILGYTVANDVTARDWQRRTSQFLAGKTFESTSPLGPWIVTRDEVDPNDGLRIGCIVDGETVQEASTADLLFDAVHLVSYLSQIVTLTPGDVILTGTPGGVGAAATPPRRLSPGQVLTTFIEGLGTCENRCVLPQPSQG